MPELKNIPPPPDNSGVVQIKKLNSIPPPPDGSGIVAVSALKKGYNDLPVATAADNITPKSESGFWNEVGRQLYSEPDPNNPTVGYKLIHPLVESAKSGAKKITEAIPLTIQGQADKMKDYAIASSNNELGSAVGHDVLKAVTGTAQVAFNLLPIPAAFQVATNAVKESVKAIAPEDAANKINDVLDVPFSAASHIAQWSGYKPEEDSNGKIGLELLDIIGAALLGKAAHASGITKLPRMASDGIKSLLTDAKSVADAKANGAIGDEHVQQFADHFDAAKNISLEDVKKAAEAKGTPEALKVADMVSKAQKNVDKVNVPPIDSQHDILGDAVQNIDTNDIRTKLSNMLDAGNIDQQRFDEITHKLNAYDKYYSQVKDRGYSPEKNKEIFDLTYKAENIGGLIKTIESDKTASDPIQQADLKNLKEHHRNYINQLADVMAGTKAESNETANTNQVTASTEAQTKAGGINEIPVVNNILPPTEPVEGTTKIVTEGERPVENVQDLSDEHFVNKFINSGAITGKEAFDAKRVEFRDMTRAEVQKAITDIKYGNKNSVPAKRLIDNILKIKETGEIPFTQGTGGNSRGTAVNEPLANYNDFIKEAPVEHVSEEESKQMQSLQDYIEYKKSNAASEPMSSHAQNEMPLESLSAEEKFPAQLVIKQELKTVPVVDEKGEPTGDFFKIEKSDERNAITQEELDRHIEEGGKQLTRSEQKAQVGTGFAHADVALSREQKGLEPLEKHIIAEVGKKAWEDTKVKTENGTIDPIEVAKDILQKGKDAKEGKTDTESAFSKQAVIVQEIARIEQEYKLTNRLMNQASESGMTDLSKSFADRLKAMEDNLTKLQDANNLIGSQLGQALGFRSNVIKDDMSVASVMSRLKAAENGKESPKVAEVQKLLQKHENLQAAFEKEQSKTAQLTKRVDVLENSEKAAIEYKKQVEAVKAAERKSGRKEKVAQIDKEIDDTYANLKRIAIEQRGRLSANPIPAEMIPELAKLVGKYAQKGIVELSQVVDDIYSKLKDHIEGLEYSHVEDEVKAALAVHELEESSGDQPVAKTATQRKQESAEKRTDKLIKEYQRRIKEKDFSSKSKAVQVEMTDKLKELKELQKKVKAQYDLEKEKGFEVEKLKNKINGIIEQRENVNKTFSEKVSRFAVDLANVPKSLKSSLDFSAPLRQGAILSVGNPKIAKGAFAEMFKHGWSEKIADKWLYELKSSPEYNTIKKSDLYLSEPHSLKLNEREETFMSNLAEKIPVIGTRGIKGSERAYAGYLNKLRVDCFAQGVDILEKNGKTFESDPESYKAWADYINNATGRGKLGAKLERAAPVLNAIFFSPRLIASRFNILGNTVTAFRFTKLPPELRKVAIRDMASFIGFGSMAATLAAFGGATVALNPLSTDFGKLKFGKTRFDMWAGLQQEVRMMSQVVTGLKKNTRSGQVQSLESQGSSRLNVLGQFARGKLSPVASTMVNLLSGKDFIGKPVKFSTEAANLVMPFIVQDTYELYRDEGLGTAAGSVIPNLFGVGVQHYGD